MEAELVGRGIRLFEFHLEHSRPLTSEEVSGSEEMERLTRSSGGEVVQILQRDSAGEEQARLQKLSPKLNAELRSVYRLDLRVPSLVKAGKVKIQLVNRPRESGGTLVYSRVVLPCKSASNPSVGPQPA